MKLEQAMRMAVPCGLYTVTEAIMNVEVHASMFMVYSEMSKEFDELYKEFEEWQEAGNPDKIPQHIIDEENALMEKYFSMCEELEDEDNLCGQL